MQVTTRSGREETVWPSFRFLGIAVVILKLFVVPVFIGLVTLAGRRWGAGVAGLLGGFPIVAGPIVVFVALEQGSDFGAKAAIAAISAIAGLMVFALAYCWSCIRWQWPVALGYASLAWLVTAAALAAFELSAVAALSVAVLSLFLTPLLLTQLVLPPDAMATPAKSTLVDLPYRMLTGAMLTLAVTAAAATLGQVWSGLLAVFPIIGLVLAVFTHRNQGPQQVITMYRGMVKGLYSFIAFFLTLAMLWPQLQFWTACTFAVAAGLIVQLVVQGLVFSMKQIRLP